MIEQLKQDEHFIKLKQEVDTKQQKFEAIQQEIEKKEDVINRNKKIIHGIHADIANLEDKINNTQADDSGNIDLNAIEKYSTKIYANKNKISVLTKINEKISNEASYLKITSYIDKEKELEAIYKDLFDYSFEFCIKHWITDNFTHELNILFKMFRNTRLADNFTKVITDNFTTTDAFISYLEQKLKPLLCDVSLEALSIQGYQKKFIVPSSLMERQAKKRELEKILSIPQQ